MSKKEIYTSLKENNVPTEPSETVVKKFVHMIQYSLNTGKLHYKIPFMVTIETEKRYYLQGNWHVSKDKHDIVQKLGGDTGEVIYTVYHVVEKEIPILTRKTDYNKLDKTAKKCAETDLTASELYNMVTGQNKNEYYTLIVE